LAFSFFGEGDWVYSLLLLLYWVHLHWRICCFAVLLSSFVFSSEARSFFVTLLLNYTISLSLYFGLFLAAKRRIGFVEGGSIGRIQAGRGDEGEEGANDNGYLHCIYNTCSALVRYQQEIMCLLEAGQKW
jgi:hypothetical protein